MRLGKSYLDYFEADRLDLEGVPVADYPLIPEVERDFVLDTLECCLRHKIPTVSGNHSVWKTINGVTRRCWMRWKNEPQLDEKGRVAGIISYGKVIKEASHDDVSQREYDLLRAAQI